MGPKMAEKAIEAAKADLENIPLQAEETEQEIISTQKSIPVWKNSEQDRFELNITQKKITSGGPVTQESQIHHLILLLNFTCIQPLFT
ncbi:hypothetical protein [Photobacterium sp.]|uniref:hypothetical protein n=1 Tax=Photobacterium sp. TaxID=660 RepID=UPI00299D2BEB|nr:hypothetical protein [Photobacterium sp.]MDX1303621.1 hypothetical protein [Photobacterium sp.]